jgi:hypothetical protein|tara:strand:+ start:597 stop:1298 length:702 start_codon:yes stop_codon:yes gene_type:complete
MADVNCYGQLVSSRATIVPLLNTAQTENAEEETKTDSNFVGSAQTAGTFATQQFGGFVLSKAGIVCENDFSYSFIRSAGKIKCALPMVSGLAGGGAGLPSFLPYAKQLASGDQVITMASAVTDRTAAVSVACTNGEYHVFAITASGSGEHEFVSVLDGQGIGVTLQGRTISHWMASSGNNDAEVTSPVYLLDGSGVPTASVVFSSSGASTAMQFEPTRAPVALNSRLVYRTDA